MKNNNFINGIKTTVSKVGFKVKKHSPEILVVTGIIGVVTSAVMACKATTKVKNIMDDSKKQLDDVQTVLSDETKADVYSKEDAQKDIAVVHVQTGIKLAKLYAPPVLIGAASITCILASHNILNKRNAAIAAAYAAVDEGLKKYKKRVSERFGEEAEREISYGIKSEQTEGVVKDPETGKEKKVKNTVNVFDKDFKSPYSLTFDSSCGAWERDHEYNMMYLRSEQQYANDRLKARGYLYLNEVYERLGVAGTKMGQVVGWVYDPDNPDYDNFVDFGIREFNIGDENHIMLDFNVQGNILDLMP